MSYPGQTTCICSVCGKKSRQQVLTSTNRFGAPDLDLRPPEMMRSTMGWWIQECPRCGYISDNLETVSGIDRKWLKSKDFRSANGIAFASKLAKKFYKRYLISVADQNIENAFHAAWSCDDSGDEENAVLCRQAALEQLDLLIAADKEDKECGDEDPAETYRLIRMDLLRRTNQFARVIDEYAQVEFSSELLNRVKAFQIERAKQNDPRCYTVDDCTN